LDLIQGGVAGSDDGDWAAGHGRAVHGGQVAEITQRLQGLDDVRPSSWAVGLNVNEEVECLGTDGVVDAVLGGAGDERRCWVLALENINEGVDVEGLESAEVGQGGLLVANLMFELVSVRL